MLLYKTFFKVGTSIGKFFRIFGGACGKVREAYVGYIL